MNRLLCLIGMFVLAGHSAYGATYDYTAKVKGKVAKSGTVTASGIKWQCGGSKCTVSGPWANPGVGACRALASQVGVITSYGHEGEKGHKGKKLSSGQLKTCNQDAAGSASKLAVTTMDSKKLQAINQAQKQQKQGSSGGKDRKNQARVPMDPNAKSLAQAQSKSGKGQSNAPLAIQNPDAKQIQQLSNLNKGKQEQPKLSQQIEPLSARESILQDPGLQNSLQKAEIAQQKQIGAQPLDAQKDELAAGRSVGSLPLDKQLEKSQLSQGGLMLEELKQGSAASSPSTLGDQIAKLDPGQVSAVLPLNQQKAGLPEQADVLTLDKQLEKSQLSQGGLTLEQLRQGSAIDNQLSLDSQVAKLDPAQVGAALPLDQQKAGLAQQAGVVSLNSQGEELVPGTRTLPENANPLESAKSIDLSRLQPLDAAEVQAKAGTVTGINVEGLRGGTAINRENIVTILPDNGGFSEPGAIPQESGDPRDLGMAINEYLNGPRIEQLGGYENCLTANQTFQIVGNRFGDDSSGRRVMLAYLGQGLESLSIVSWENDRITVRIPGSMNNLVAGRAYEVGIQSAAGQFWVSNLYRGLPICATSFQIAGTLSVPEACNPEDVTIYITDQPSGDVYQNSIISAAFTSPGRYSITVPGPGNYRMALNPHRFCTGRWQPGPGEVTINIPPQNPYVIQNFNYSIDYERQLRSISILRLERTTVLIEYGEFCTTSTPYSSPIDPDCRDLELAQHLPFEIVVKASTRVCSLPDFNVTIAPSSGIPFTLSRPVQECLEPGVEYPLYMVAPGTNLRSNFSSYQYCTYGGSNSCRSYLFPGARGTISASFEGLSGTFNAEFAVGQHPTSTTGGPCLAPLDGCERRQYPVFATRQTAVSLR